MISAVCVQTSTTPPPTFVKLGSRKSSARRSVAGGSQLDAVGAVIADERRAEAAHDR